MRTMLVSIILGVVFQNQTAVAFQDIDLGTVTEKHQMIPMRDGKHLSSYLYIPQGDGPWPVIGERRWFHSAFVTSCAPVSAPPPARLTRW